MSHQNVPPMLYQLSKENSLEVPNPVCNEFVDRISRYNLNFIGDLVWKQSFSLNWLDNRVLDTTSTPFIR